MLEAGDKPSTGEKLSPPSSTTWSEIAPPSVSSAESWAEVEAVAPAPTLRDVVTANKQRELFQQHPCARTRPSRRSWAYSVENSAAPVAEERMAEEASRNGRRSATRCAASSRRKLSVLVAKLDRPCAPTSTKPPKEEIGVNIDKIDVRTFRELQPLRERGGLAKEACVHNRRPVRLRGIKWG